MRGNYKQWPYGMIMVFIVAILMASACRKPGQYVQSVDTEMMVADVNDMSHKILVLTSAVDQTLLSATFPPSEDNYFKIADITVNRVSLKELTGKSVDYSQIDYDIKAGDTVRVDVVFAPKKFPEPGQPPLRTQVLTLLFSDHQVGQVIFNLSGVSYGECRTCVATISGDPHVFEVKELTIHITDPDVGSVPDQTAQVTGDLTIYIDEAGGKAFIKGEDFPRFTLDAQGTEVAVVGEAGTYSGIYEAGDITILGVHVKAGGMIDLFTDLTSKEMSIPEVYENRTDVPEYADLVDIAQSSVTVQGSPLTNGEITLVGGIIGPANGLLGDLQGGIVDFKFVLKEKE